MSLWPRNRNPLGHGNICPFLSLSFLNFKWWNFHGALNMSKSWRLTNLMRWGLQLTGSCLLWDGFLPQFRLHKHNFNEFWSKHNFLSCFSSHLLWPLFEGVYSWMWYKMLKLLGFNKHVYTHVTDSWRLPFATFILTPSNTVDHTC